MFTFPTLLFFFLSTISPGKECKKAPVDSIVSYTNQLVYELHNVNSIVPLVDTSSFCTTIDSVASQLQKKLGRLSNTVQAADSIVSFVYNHWNINFNENDLEITGMLPQTVLMKKNGGCLGVTLLMLIMGQKIGCPLYGVILPGHVFVRYDNGTIYRNIEPNKKGFCHPDDYYRSQYLQQSSKRYTLQNSSVEEMLAILHYNLANSISTGNDFESAEFHYLKCLDLFPTYAEAWGNLAIHYDSHGMTDKAKDAFNKAELVQPDLYNLALNKGYFEIKYNDRKAALETFKKGLNYYPHDINLNNALNLLQSQCPLKK